MMYSFRGKWRDVSLATASLLGAVLFTSAVPLANAQAPAQQADSKPAESNASITLDVTMKLIERDLNSIGKVTWTQYSRDSKTSQNYKTEPMTAEVSGVRTHASSCRLEYHSQEVTGKVLFGPPVRESDHIIALGEYDYDFIATPMARDLDTAALRGGHPEWTNRVEPSVYVVRPSSGALHEFWFYDEMSASRVATALNEAANVCGGRRKSLRTNMGPLGDVTRVASESIARLTMATQSPRVQARFPGLTCVATQSEMSQKYQSGGTVNGERVTIKCDQQGRTVSEGSWSTEFRFSISPLDAGSFLGAKVASEEVLVKVLSLSGFQPDDLAEMASSPIPEVRIGAAGNLSDQGLLYKLAKEDKVASVRKAALDKLIDQALLEKLTSDGTDPSVREGAARRLTNETVLGTLAAQSADRDVRRAAVEQLNDPATLASIVTREKEWTVRMAAVKNITDQALLTKIATGDADGTVRYSALKKLTDQSLLAKLATEHADPRLRDEATAMLTDQAVLARIAIQDPDWLVRLAAVNNLTDQAVLAKVAAEDIEARVRRVARQKITSKQ